MDLEKLTNEQLLPHLRSLRKQVKVLDRYEDDVHKMAASIMGEYEKIWNLGGFYNLKRKGEVITRPQYVFMPKDVDDYITSTAFSEARDTIPKPPIPDESRGALRRVRKILRSRPKLNLVRGGLPVLLMALLLGGSSMLRHGARNEEGA